MYVVELERSTLVDLDITLSNREVIMNKLINDGEFEESIDVPYLENNQVPTDVIANYQEIETICLESHTLLIVDIAIIDFYLTLNLCSRLDKKSKIKQNYNMADITTLYNMEKDLALLNFKIALCEILDIDAGDYIYLKDVKYNEIECFKDNIE